MLIVRELCRTGLSPVSFELSDGECVVIQGPSGSGKTLLLRAIADLDPNRGQISLQGQAREIHSGPAWRRRVVYVPAESGWWGTLVGEHFPVWEHAIPLVEALRLSAAAHDWPIQRLSTGERQRLALVRALLLQPEVLLLDEPTAALDAEATAAVEQLVTERLQNGTSVLWVSHDSQQAARLAKRGFFLNAGQFREAAL
ncbi:MAG: ABC transporter ATP-binding protein [Candidatus Competibacteraceae bacterium]|jgi:phosphate-transporting ATPase|nr:ABC transporter ATP-binding protein [Candidatus Competibacteraceae bacterium]